MQHVGVYMLWLMMSGPHGTCLTEDVGLLLLLAFYLCDISHAWVDINSWMQIMFTMLRVWNPGCMNMMLMANTLLMPNCDDALLISQDM